MAPLEEPDDERTTVEDGPPPPGRPGDRLTARGKRPALDESWDDKTTVESERETAHGTPVEPGLETTRDDSADILLDERTVQEDGRRLAEGSDLGASTIDELTVEDQAKPLPPLSVVPPVPSRTLAPPVDPARGRLVVIAGNDSGRQFDLTGARLTIGRGVDNDIILTDIAVSRRHVDLEFDGKRYIVRDLGSGNGTLVNDRLDGGTSYLRHGDRVELGNTVFRVEHPSSRDDIAPVGWGAPTADIDEEASTVAGRGPARPGGAGLPPPRRVDQRPAGLPAHPPGATLPPSQAPLAAHESLPFMAARDSQPPMAARDSYPYMGAYPPQMAQSGHPMGLPMHPGMRQGTVSLAPDRRLLIGIMSALLAIVLVAIVLLVVRGDDSATGQAAAGEPGADESEAAASEPGADELVAAPDEPDEADEPGQDEPDEPAAATDEPAIEIEPESVAAANDEPAATNESATNEPATNDEPAARDRPERPAVTLPRATWGTDEGLLAVAVTRQAREQAEEAQQTGPRRPAARVDRRPRPRPGGGSSGSSTGAARGRALSQYKGKDFGAASATLLAAAESASGKEASELRSVAKGYASVGNNLGKAEKIFNANPTGSMSAYKRALATDRKVGGGAHASYIRIKLGAVAPKAAAAYMAQRRYESAKSAADDAANYGSGSNSTVVRVRKALERKAGEFYQAALKLRSSKPDKARTLLRRVLKMVPADSPWYAKSYKLLNSRKSSNDADE